LTRDTYAYIIK